MMSKRFNELLNLYLEQTATKKEEAEFFDMLSSGSYDEFVLNSLDDFIVNEVGKSPSILETKLTVHDNERVSSSLSNTYPKFKLFINWSIAALLIIIGSIFIYNPIFSKNNHQVFENNFKKQHSFEATNLSKHNKLIVLPDGSKVSLNPNSSIFYSRANFLNDRTVMLKGEAFFDINKNKLKPFRVYYDDIVTYVLGTSFNIKKNKVGNIEVEVLSGKVKVYQNELIERLDKSLSDTITPNQKIIYSDELHSFTKGLVDVPVLVVKKTILDMKEGHEIHQFHFKNTPLDEIFKTLQANYNIKFQVQNLQINNCLFSGDLSKTELFDQLKIICLATNLTYRIDQTSIVIKGSGCKL